VLDVQWSTDHLAGLGVIEVPREEYLRRLRLALPLPLPPAFGGALGAAPGGAGQGPAEPPAGR
jgi:leucyl/phenylalanyl-tRNA--protein transferase